MRLIDADALKKKKVDVQTTTFEKDGHYSIIKIQDGKGVTVKDIDEAPTIEAEPVRHGEWIEDGTNIVCSVCKTEFSDEIAFMKRTIDPEKPKRCPECGAKMEGGAENA